MVQEADRSLLVWDGLCAVPSDSASELFSCVSGFSLSAVIQNALKKWLDAAFLNSSKLCFPWAGFL